ncbi:unnamed protein product [Symbiodinium natans]|uniref:Prostaglandin F synthase n=1 Tax=Symbiodinium natans TaxID=878477 RepID=A0A812V6J1_9DINO|nr:unnamed protein product [Symbiodinium natans]
MQQVLDSQSSPELKQVGGAVRLTEVTEGPFCVISPAPLRSCVQAGCQNSIGKMSNLLQVATDVTTTSQCPARTARIHREGSPGVVDSQSGTQGIHRCPSIMSRSEPLIGFPLPRLRVLGTTNLRVADTSVYPESPSGHSDAPARLVGELCARFVLRDIAARGKNQEHSGEASVQLRGYRSVRMPLRGFGTNGVQGEQVQKSLKMFFQLGGRMVDTAVLYDNHADIGHAIAKSKIPREEVFIVSKIPPTQMGYDETYDAVLRSVDELGTHLDLVLLHWPSNFDSKDPLPECASVSWRACRAAAWKGLERAFKAGKVRALGVSNFGVQHLSALLADGPSLPIAVNQVQTRTAAVCCSWCSGEFFNVVLIGCRYRLLGLKGLSLIPRGLSSTCLNA